MCGVEMNEKLLTVLSESKSGVTASFNISLT